MKEEEEEKKMGGNSKPGKKAPSEENKGLHGQE